jgi:hypothetical protein
MWNPPTQKQLDKLPRLYETEKVKAEDKIIHMHFFIGSCDWYIAEYDGEDSFFGYANLGDPQNAEWGYISLSEMKSLSIRGIEIDRDLHWNQKKFSEIS